MVQRLLLTRDDNVSQTRLANVGSGAQLGPSAQLNMGSMNQLSQRLWRQSAEVGRRVSEMMGEEAAEEAAAYASAITLSEDENGVPQVPEGVTADLGRVGRRAFDSQMQERVGYRLANLIDGTFREAYFNNPTDMAGFQSAVDERLDELSQGVDPQFAATFEKLTLKAGARYGAKIGAAMHEQKIEQASMDHVARIKNMTGAVVDQIHIGNQDAADAEYAMVMAQIDAIDPQFITERGRQKLKDDARRTIVGAQIMQELNLKEVNPFSIARAEQVRAELVSGLPGDTGITKMLEDENGLVDEGLKSAVLSRIQTWLGGAGQKMAADGKAASAQADQDRIMRGAYSDGSRPMSKATSETYERMIAEQFPDNPGAAIEGLMWTVEANPQHESNALQIIRRAGRVPNSMKMAASSVMTNGSDQDVENFARYYQRLRMFDHPETGHVRDMTDQFDDETRAFFESYLTLQNAEGVSYSPERALSIIRDGMNAEIDIPLRDSVNEINGWFYTADTDKEAREQLGMFMRHKLEEDFSPADRHVEEAVRMWEVITASGQVKPTRAFEVVTQQMAGRYTESRYTFAGRASAAAPDRVYPELYDRNFFEHVNKWELDNIPGYRGLVDWMGGAGRQVVGWSEFDFYADKQIRQAVKEDPNLTALHSERINGPLEAGIDYYLVPRNVDDKYPKYEVRLKTPITSGGFTGIRGEDDYEYVPIGVTVDFGPTYQRLQKASQARDEQDIIIDWAGATVRAKAKETGLGSELHRFADMIDSLSPSEIFIDGWEQKFGSHLTDEELVFLKSEIMPTLFDAEAKRNASAQTLVELLSEVRTWEQ